MNMRERSLIQFPLTALKALANSCLHPLWFLFYFCETDKDSGHKEHSRAMKITPSMPVTSEMIHSGFQIWWMRSETGCRSPTCCPSHTNTDRSVPLADCPAELMKAIPSTVWHWYYPGYVQVSTRLQENHLLLYRSFCLCVSAWTGSLSKPLLRVYTSPDLTFVQEKCDLHHTS